MTTEAKVVFDFTFDSTLSNQRVRRRRKDEYEVFNTMLYFGYSSADDGHSASLGFRSPAGLPGKRISPYVPQ